MCFGLVTTVVSVVSSSEEDELPSDEISSTVGVVFVSIFLSFFRSPDVLRDALLSSLRGVLRLSLRRRRVLVCFSYNLNHY